MKLTSLLSFLFLATFLEALPIDKSKRLYQPTSPIFTLIAQHKGEDFKYKLVKFDGKDLILNADESLFFGRIRANGGYTLNIPFGNNTSNYTNPPGVQNASNVSSGNGLQPPLSSSVFIDGANKLTVASNRSASFGFGISNSLLTYQNSTSFLACPVYSNSSTALYSNRTILAPFSKLNSTGTYNTTTLNSTALNQSVPYHLYFNGGRTKARCPSGSPGYNVTLLVEVAATVDYSPLTNTFMKRFLSFFM